MRQLQLSSDTEIKPFKCAEEDLNGFLFEDAKHFHQELMAVTYLLEDTSENVTVAYFSLLADKITFNPDEKSIWNRLNRNIPNPKRRKSYPAIKIGRLAVNEEFTGQANNEQVLIFRAFHISVCRPAPYELPLPLISQGINTCLSKHETVLTHHGQAKKL